ELRCRRENANVRLARFSRGYPRDSGTQSVVWPCPAIERSKRNRLSSRRRHFQRRSFGRRHLLFLQTALIPVCSLYQPCALTIEFPRDVTAPFGVHGKDSRGR